MSSHWFSNTYTIIQSYLINKITSRNWQWRSVVKSKITKILNSEENSKRKFTNQMAKSNDKTHQTNRQQLSYSWLGTDIFKCRKWWIEPGFKALNLSPVQPLDGVNFPNKRVWCNGVLHMVQWCKMYDAMVYGVRGMV